MTRWRYKAIAAAGGSVERGVLAGASPADVRSSLRRAGMRALDIRPERAALSGQFGSWTRFLQPYIRTRRCAIKADLFDSLATLIGAGIPLAEAVETASGSAGRNKSLASMLGSLRDQLRDGSPLADAMRNIPGWGSDGAGAEGNEVRRGGGRGGGGWFDEIECAIVDAGETSGELQQTLVSLSDRLSRSRDLDQRLIGALAYPALVATVGLGVVVFLSTKTLPDLVGVLEGADVPPPPLTLGVMAFGQLLVGWWWALLLALVLTVGLIAYSCARLSKHDSTLWHGVRHIIPRFKRRMILSRVLRDLVELLRAGVPAVEALRSAADTAGGLAGSDLARQLRQTANDAERGATIEQGLTDGFWFDNELRRLIATGEFSGELDTVLDKTAARYDRVSRAAVDRFAAMLEPATILVLAALIGLVVMAAMLPLIRLQEIL